MSLRFRPALAAFVTGLVFAAGLALAGMTQPAKVVAFLNVAGDWDPSLAFVMLGAIGVYMPLHRLILRRTNPVYGAAFQVPTRRELDPKLLAGSALFGLGWGFAGFCPGPAVVAAGALAPSAMVFCLAMLLGMLMHRLLFASPREQPGEPNPKASSQFTGADA